MSGIGDGNSEWMAAEVESERIMAKTPKVTIGYTQLLTAGVKHDSNKLRMDLIPVSAVEALAEVLTYGASKYADRNWEKGLKWSRVFGATMRHLWAWYRGESTDPESGHSHLAHAMCNIAFLIEYSKRRPEFDDRPL